jgi:hypothetical protein
VNLRANTKAGYRSTLRGYLRPAFAAYPLARIDALAVRTWLAKLEAEGVGQATRAKAYRLLARIMAAAVEARYLAVNPCSIRRAASDGAPEMRIVPSTRWSPSPTGCRRAAGRWSWWRRSVGCAGGSWPGCGAATSTGGSVTAVRSTVLAGRYGPSMGQVMC